MITIPWIYNTPLKSALTIITKTKLMIIMMKIDHKPFLDLIKKKKTLLKKIIKKRYKNWPKKS